MLNKKVCVGIILFLNTYFIVFSQQKTTFNNKEFSSLIIKATAAKISGDLLVADSLFKECLKINPESGVANFELSGICLSNENYPNALLYAQKAVVLSRDNEWYLANLAQLYKDQGELKKSSIYFKELSEKYPQKLA